MRHISLIVIDFTVFIFKYVKSKRTSAYIFFKLYLFYPYSFFSFYLHIK
jgi:hypothetical protein